MENTKSLRERVIAGLEERRERILNGDINCIPLPFKRFQSELPGIEQETYYLISGGTKSAKTRLVNYIFVYNTIICCYKNKLYATNWRSLIYNKTQRPRRS